jgi:hypothetical protein
MTLLEVLRLVWTIGTGIGTLIQLYLFREVVIDDRAISQVRPPRADFLRVHTRGEIWDQAILTLAVFVLFLAGVLAYVELGMWAIPLLVASAASLVSLGILKLSRRRRIFRTLRLNRKAR